MQREQQRLIDEYIHWLDTVRSLTSPTISHTGNTLQAWAGFLEGKGASDLRHASAQSVLEWIEHRRVVDQVQEVTIGADLCILRTFYCYLVDYGGSTNPTGCLPEFICKSRFDRGYLTVEEVFSMLESLDTRNVEGRRDYVIIALLWSCGLRTSELLDLQWRDIDLKEATLLVRKGKGRKQRQLFLNDRVLEDLQQYRNSVLGGEEAPVFCRFTNAKKSGVTRVALDHHELAGITKSCATKAGIQRNVTPLLLRHTFATHMYEAGIPVRDIQEMMGHSTQTETAIYIHVTLAAAKTLLNEHVYHTLHHRGEA